MKKISLFNLILSIVFILSLTSCEKENCVTCTGLDSISQAAFNLVYSGGELCDGSADEESVFQAACEVAGGVME